MSDPTEPVPLTSTAPAGTEAGTARYSVPETARLLGISERAVRKRITAGTLDAHKEGSAWVVLLPSTIGAVPAAPAALGAVPESGTQGGTASPVGDMAPLADLIATLSRENQELAAAASVWQYRAMRAEERVAQLEAGPIDGDVDQAAQDVPQERAGATLRGDQSAPAPDSLIDRVRRLLGRS